MDADDVQYFFDFCQKSNEDRLDAIYLYSFLSIYSTGLTGLEPATSAVTGRCSNQLNYSPKFRNFIRDNFYSASIIRVCQLHLENYLVKT